MTEKCLGWFTVACFSIARAVLWRTGAVLWPTWGCVVAYRGCVMACKGCVMEYRGCVMAYWGSSYEFDSSPHRVLERSSAEAVACKSTELF